STWLSAFFALLIVLIVGFFVTFPSLLKAPIESQLADATDLTVDISKLSFEINSGISLKIHDLTFGQKNTSQPLAHIKGLHWQVQLANLFEDIYYPNRIAIDELTLYADNQSASESVSVGDVDQLVAKETLEMAHFFESLAIEKTRIQGERIIELAPVVIGHNQGQLVLNIISQPIGEKIVDVKLALSSEQFSKTGVITVPMVIQNEDFSLLSNIKLYQQNNQDYVEFTGFVDQIQAVDLDDYVSAAIVGESTNRWMKRGFKSGVLDNAHIHLVKNLSDQAPATLNFTAHLAETELLFNSDWNTLKGLDADIITDGKKIQVMVNRTELYDLPLTDMALEIEDMSQHDLDVRLRGSIATNSKDFIQFLADAPSGKTVHEVIQQFSLVGPLRGELDLIIPLDDRESTLDVDLIIQDNQLTTLDGAIVINDYDSTIAFHDNQITTKGVGNIRDTPFDIRINPHNRGDDQQASFAVELINNDSEFELYLTKRLDQTWRARIESEALKTNLAIELTQTLPKVNVLGLQAASTDTLKGDWNIQPNDLPDMWLSTQGVFVDEQEIPDFSAKLESANNVLKITDLSFEGIGVGEQELSFDGAWVAGKTRLLATAKGKGLNEFLQKLKIKEQVTGGEFDFDVRLFCNCTPWNMSFKNVSGIAKMKVKEGVFTDKDPNIGRVLSLLNIKSIAKRLKLDVADLTDKGFVYDSIDAQVTVQDALAKINHFELAASSSAITLSGQSHIIDEVYDIEAKVTPAISDAVPAATYLAGGGLIGLGVWLVDQSLFDGKFIDQLIDEVVQFKYKITGPWDEPTIENISSIL
ncbi:MAG: DUF3971 domain-containing protein, partial [Candidatus Thioglobus sp.]|nr:DUF3971 domain-containing protein [Candidatus Thioglobus sp.]